MVDYFTEVFPLDGSKIGQLVAYDIAINKGSVNAVIDDLLMRFRKAFSGHWIWTGQHIITDNAPSPVQIDITLDVLRNEFPAIFAHIESVTENSGWHPTIEDVANFVAHHSMQDYDDAIRRILRKHGTRIHNAYVMRDYSLRGWEVDGQPALSFTLNSRLLYLRNVQSIFEQEVDTIGLQVIDKSNARNIGTIAKIAGTIKDLREELLKKHLI